MIEQYLEIKKEHHDCLLFYRIGEFYELFFDDAHTVSNSLGITLTKRGKYKGEDVPLCGIPAKSLEIYLGRLVKDGHKVAVAEQVVEDDLLENSSNDNFEDNDEDQKARGDESSEGAGLGNNLENLNNLKDRKDKKGKKSKGKNKKVSREVVRVFTAGTLVEDELIESGEANFLLAICGSYEECELVLFWCDVSTGELFFDNVSVKDLQSYISRIAPKEIIVDYRMKNRGDVSDIFNQYSSFGSAAISVYDPPENRKNVVSKQFRQEFTKLMMSKLGQYEIKALHYLLSYVERNQKQAKLGLNNPVKYDKNRGLILDDKAVRQLEMVQNFDGKRKGSLIDIIDKTVTASGKRLFRKSLLQPLNDRQAIEERLDNVELLLKQKDLRNYIRQMLGEMPDLERVVTRAIMGRATPRDLLAVKIYLDGVGKITGKMERFLHNCDSPKSFSTIVSCLHYDDELWKKLDEALEYEVPATARDGNFIRNDYDPVVLKLREQRDKFSSDLRFLQVKYRKSTGISNLVIKNNNILGYFVEVKPQYSNKMEECKEVNFVHRQTNSSSVRYINDELKNLEHGLIGVCERLAQLEIKIFEDLVNEVIKRSDSLIKTARAMARVDVLLSLASLAEMNNYQRPKIVSDDIVDIKNGRHPVIENIKQDKAVANDCRMGNIEQDNDFIYLITGPNMAGKSTFLRQNAIIVIMAHLGSFVPAANAVIGVRDRIFTRIGSADNLAQNQSTFMMEMIETANIAKNATAKSLVIVDELGRGTSTRDGMAIARAILESLHDKSKSLTLFATHYHELVDISEKLSRCSCYRMKVEELPDDIRFTFKIERGYAKHSYGVYTAQLAGLPPELVERAKELLGDTLNNNADNDKIREKIA